MRTRIAKLASMPAESSKAPSQRIYLSCSQPSSSFVINLQTAKTIGLTVPDKLLVAADEVID